MKPALLPFRITVGLGSICTLLVAGCAPQASSDREAEIVGLVDDAAALLASKGEAAFAEFQQPGSKWRQGDDYLFVSKTDGTVIFHPVRPDMVGNSQLDLTDVNGKEFIREMLEVASSKGSGWVEYMWPKPGTTEPVSKASYVRSAKIGDEAVIVGAGLYRD